MSLTEMVLMPGGDYQQICDNLRTVYPQRVNPIRSGEAAEMVGGIPTLIGQAKREMDWIVNGDAKENYYNNRVTSIRAYAFYYAGTLTGTIEFPNVTSLGSGAFRNSAIEKAVFPQNVYSGTTVFQSCTKLQHLDLGTSTSVAAGLCMDDTMLTEVVLRKTNAIAPLSNVNAFSGTPFASGGTGGKIYVPEALIGDYQKATNWSVLYGYGNCEFVALEGSEYE